MLGSTWFLAHVVASTFLFLSIAVAVRADDSGFVSRAVERPRGMARQVLAGLLFGTAALARLTTLFGAPFFAVVGGGGSWSRRTLAAGVGAGLPVVLLLTYNLATTGASFHPAYEHLRVEYRPRPELVNPDWASRTSATSPERSHHATWPPERPLDDPACADRPSAPTALDQTCPLLRPTRWV
jgi:hypothetical protein